MNNSWAWKHFSNSIINHAVALEHWCFIASIDQTHASLSTILHTLVFASIMWSIFLCLQRRKQHTWDTCYVHDKIKEKIEVQRWKHLLKIIIHSVKFCITKLHIRNEVTIKHLAALTKLGQTLHHLRWGHHTCNP